jgi:polyisoprenoid-binding protein YceI
MRHTTLMLGTVVLAICFGAINLQAQAKSIDGNKSKLKIHVLKSGAFSAFAHDHEIEAPIAEGKVDASGKSVQLRVESRKMRVLDPEISADKRAEIQHTMAGASVLDVEKYPEISYQSNAVTSRGEGHWEVRGDLTLHGKKEPVVVDVTLQNGHYKGAASFKQTTFGMSPISIAGGTVKVKDELKIEFDIVLAQ